MLFWIKKMNRSCIFCLKDSGLQSVCTPCSKQFPNFVDLPCDRFFMQDYADIKQAMNDLSICAGGTAYIYWCCRDGTRLPIFEGKDTYTIRIIDWPYWRSFIKNFYAQSMRCDSRIFAGLTEPSFDNVVLAKGPDPNCPECKGTGEYVGFNKIEVCRTCG